ncbi:MAG: hypothetical protein KatS3mg126_0293 [Lysobacteraceae bacterium]|nr:MAG: hypothetical protein KatS3mg126_0293 [Xanthomonadaceae bacterium]
MTLLPSRSPGGMKISLVSLRRWYSTDCSSSSRASLALALLRPPLAFCRAHSSSRAMAFCARLLLVLLLLQALLLLHQPLGVVALPGDAAAAVELEDPFGGVVEEVAVVGDRHHGARVALQELLQPLHRLGVEVVGRLVEEQHVRLGEQQPAQGHAALLASGEVLDARIPRRQAQGVGGHLELLLQGVGIARGEDRLEALLLLGKGVEVRALLGVGGVDLLEALLRLQDLADAFLDRLAHRVLGVELGLLLEVADLDPGLRAGLADEVLVDPGHDPQHGRLAGTVEAEQADLGAGEERQRDVLDDLPLGGNDLAHPVHGVDVLHGGRVPDRRWGDWQGAAACGRGRGTGPGMPAGTGPAPRSDAATGSARLSRICRPGSRALPLGARREAVAGTKRSMIEGFPADGARMFPADTCIADFDPELAAAIRAERARQEDHVELIASENYASPRVLEAQGSVLTNKYAEGYPGKRYYGGCEHVDVAERLAIERARELFGADYANVQPHSGSQANAAVYLALLEPGDTILGMSLAHGGHLTHGAKVNFSGRLFHAVQYGVGADGLIDYDQIEQLAREHRPRMLVGGFSAYSRRIDWARMAKIAKSVGAYFFVDMAHVAGLVAAGVYPNPVPHADVVTSTTHKTLRGPRGGIILARGNEALEKKLQSLVFPGTQGGPLMHVIAAKAVAFKEALQPEFRAYQEQVVRNAQVMARVLMERGYRIVSGGTDNHLMLIDLIGREVTGKDAEAALGRAHITVNKNAVPNDPRSPFITSGLRIGTPAVTTRGYGEKECADLAGWIADVLDAPDDEGVIAAVREKVCAQCRAFPVYG